MFSEKQKDVLKRGFFLFFILLYVIIFAFYAHKRLPEQPRHLPGTDASNYFMMAYNLKNHGILSHLLVVDRDGERVAYTLMKYDKTVELDESDESVVPRTAWREPGYPTMLSLAMLISPTLKNITENDIVTTEGVKKKLPLRDWSYMELIILLVTSILSLIIVYKITGNRALSLLALYGVGLSPALMVYCRLYLTENFVALLLLLFSIFFYLSVKNEKWSYYVISGILLGVLALTRGIFQYAWIPIVGFICIDHFFKKISIKKTAAVALLFTVSFFLLITPWLLRNYVYLDRAFITQRGGKVLFVRSKMNMMTPTEYFVSFLWWTPTRFTDGMSGDAKKKYTEGWISKFVDYEKVKRLDLSNPESIHRISRSEASEISRKFNDPENPYAADDRMFSIGLKDIKSHPFRHLIMFFPFAWRGMFVEAGNRFFIIPASVMSLFLFIGFFAFTIRAIRKVEWENLALIAAPMYIFIMYPLVSHNLPRYQRPLIPILWITTILFLEPILMRLAVWTKERVLALSAKRSDD